MTPAAVLTLGFFLGMRHATDSDHVVAIWTIVSRQRSLRAAAPIGVLWGLGHTLALLLVGGAIVLFGLVIPPRLGLGLELSVAVMLVLLGCVNVRGAFLNTVVAHAHDHPELHAGGSSSSHRESANTDPTRRAPAMRPLLVGIVHGLAGSAAVALLVLGTIQDASYAMGYLAVFGVGTVAGMLLITTAMAMPIAMTLRRFEGVQRGLALATGMASVIFGAVLVYELSFVHGLFGAHPRWTPE
jgi:high-affinity nickel-transport protein